MDFFDYEKTKELIWKRENKINYQLLIQLLPIEERDETGNVSFCIGLLEELRGYNTSQV